MTRSLRLSVAAVIAALFSVSLVTTDCEARGYRLMGEQNTATGTAGNESVIYTYNTFADLLANNSSGNSATQINWSGTYSTAGLVYDGVYRLMGERNTATGTAGNESVIYTYNTFADLLANNSSSVSSTQIDWNSTYSTAALVYDGVYRLMGERNTATGTAGNESVIYTYNTFADLLANNTSGISATQIDWNSTYSTAGLVYDGVYRLMGERNTTTGTAGNESVIYTYNTFADLLANNTSGISATQINWGGTYSTAGLVYDGRVLRCDLNADGGVDAADASIMFANWGMSGQGDLNSDGIVDAADAGICFAEWTGDSTQSVPEPTSSSTLLVAGWLVGLAGRKFRQ